ncbi:hypothetical protein E3N88_22982 [Mikania micrantha]|uniref:FAR1 domain-containing protein n=1 Tax=Mikania micrantha TaxID=192012 RepID=A0A5N6NC00_9ASTR|nr:hypothetical protein E3N88_22982 [Mikania micrantha]
MKGFSVRVDQNKKNKDDVITHKYLRCNKVGKPKSKRNLDMLAKSSMCGRKISFQVSDCKAHIVVQVSEATSTFVICKFVGWHNCPLVESSNRDFTKVGRKLSLSTKYFINHMTLNRIGPTVSHSLQVSMKGDHHNVKGTPTDFCVVNSNLRHVFWADEISKKNYEVFGDILPFDATYYTNKMDNNRERNLGKRPADDTTEDEECRMRQMIPLADIFPGDWYPDMIHTWIS